MGRVKSLDSVSLSQSLVKSQCNKQASQKNKYIFTLYSALRAGSDDGDGSNVCTPSVSVRLTHMNNTHTHTPFPQMDVLLPLLLTDLYTLSM